MFRFKLFNYNPQCKIFMTISIASDLTLRISLRLIYQNCFFCRRSPRIFSFSHRCLPYAVFIMKFPSSSRVPAPSVLASFPFSRRCLPYIVCLVNIVNKGDKLSTMSPTIKFFGELTLNRLHLLKLSYKT